MFWGKKYKKKAPVDILMRIDLVLTSITIAPRDKGHDRKKSVVLELNKDAFVDLMNVAFFYRNALNEYQLDLLRSLLPFKKWKTIKGVHTMTITKTLNELKDSLS